MAYKLDISLSMTIDSNIHINSIDEICDALREALGFSKSNESKDFEIQLKLSNMELK